MEGRSLARGGLKLNRTSMYGLREKSERIRDERAKDRAQRRRRKRRKGIQTTWKREKGGRAGLGGFTAGEQQQSQSG